MNSCEELNCLTLRQLSDVLRNVGDRSRRLLRPGPSIYVVPPAGIKAAAVDRMISLMVAKGVLGLRCKFTAYNTITYLEPIKNVEGGFKVEVPEMEVFLFFVRI